MKRLTLVLVVLAAVLLACDSTTNSNGQDRFGTTARVDKMIDDLYGPPVAIMPDTIAGGATAKVGDDPKRQRTETPAGIDEITTWADCDSIYAEWVVWFGTLDTWFCNHWYGLRKNPSEGYEYGWLNPPVYIGTDPNFPYTDHGWRFNVAIARDDTELGGGDYFVLHLYTAFSHTGPCYNTNFFRQIYSTPELIPICGSDGGKQPKPEL